MRILTPEETREHSIFSLIGQEGAGLWRWLMLIALAAIAWLGGVAFLGPYRPTQVSRFVATIAPLDQIYLGALASALIIALISLILGRRLLTFAAATIAAYLCGLFVSGLLFHYFPADVNIPFESTEDGWRFALTRVWFAAPIAGAMLIVWLIFRAEPGVPRLSLGFGNWLVASRDVSQKERPVSWLAKLFGGYLLFVLVFAVLVQAPLGFAPIVNGTLAPVIAAILIAAAVNATAEELIYRGFIQPAFIAYGGAGAGLWMQGLFFGIIHWGLSVGILAALPTSLLIGVGSVVWGKAAYETYGLGWTIAAHFMIDVAIMAAYFAPH
jgi:membrane protease YdiL (CAAX protease family)